MTPYDELLKQENQDTQPYKLAWWQVKERQQRQEAYSLLNNAFEQFSQGTGDVAGFLDTYGRFDPLLSPKCAAHPRPISPCF